MGHANNSCMISGLTIGHQKVVAIILIKTDQSDFLHKDESQVFYPLTMPIVGTYSPDAFDLVDFEETLWTKNIVKFFKQGVKKTKQKNFTLLSLLSCMQDCRDDNFGERNQWYDIRNPNKYCLLTKNTTVAFIDFEVYEKMNKMISSEKIDEYFSRSMNDFAILDLILTHNKKKESVSQGFWKFAGLDSIRNSHFMEINEPVIKLLTHTENEKLSEDAAKKLEVIRSWLFNLGRIWVPSGYSPQDGADENILKLSKAIAKIAKSRVAGRNE